MGANVQQGKPGTQRDVAHLRPLTAKGYRHACASTDGSAALGIVTRMGRDAEGGLVGEADRARSRREAPILAVQVRISGVTFCGSLLEVAERRGGQQVDFFKVKTESGSVGWFSQWNTRLCGGVDGRCVCEQERPGARVGSRTANARARLGAVPLGNTGTTMEPAE